MEKTVVGFLVGPTASGKTAAGIELAKLLNAEIISADSIQIYRGMDIGSAKPSMEERQGIAHHLIDEADISSPKFSVAEFKRLAGERISDITSRGRFPLVVGGTGLYINALTYPLDFTAAPADETIRNELAALEAERAGTLYEMLLKEDPASAARLHPNDTKRIIRALEVLRLTGKRMGEHGGDFANVAQAEIPYIPLMAGLTMPRETLYRRINLRVDDMLRRGLIDEARGIYESGLDITLPALQGLGYKQLFRCFAGDYSEAEAIEAIKLETRHFAKRQMTWFKRDKRITWFDVSEYGGAAQLAQAIFEEYKRQCPVNSTFRTLS